MKTLIASTLALTVLSLAGAAYAAPSQDAVVTKFFAEKLLNGN